MVSSGYALALATRAPVYDAGKAGLHAFTKALRHQLAPRGVRVVEVLPPVVVAATLKAIARGRSDVLVGQTRWLPTLLRLAPATTGWLGACT